MAKIKAIDVIKGISGKVSENSGYYLYTNKKNGKQSMRKIGNNPLKTPSPAQVAQRQEFKRRTEIVKEWFDINKPSIENPDGTELYMIASKEFQRQNRIGDMYHFVWHKLFPKNK